MKILKEVIHYFSKEARIQRVWDKKSDEEILEAYKDNRIWYSNLKFLQFTSNFSLWKQVNYRYDKLIKPQMDKRNLWSKL